MIVPKSEYQEENIQTLLTWARLPLDAPSHYRPLIFHTVRGGFERAVAYTHAEITKFTEWVNANEDVVTFTLIIKQKRDKFAGVLFGRVLEETYQKALANLNAWVPVHGDVVQRVAGVMEVRSYASQPPTDKQVLSTEDYITILEIQRLYNYHKGKGNVDDTDALARLAASIRQKTEYYGKYNEGSYHDKYRYNSSGANIRYKVAEVSIKHSDSMVTIAANRGVEVLSGTLTAGILPALKFYTENFTVSGDIEVGDITVVLHREQWMPEEERYFWITVYSSRYRMDFVKIENSESYDATFNRIDTTNTYRNHPYTRPE